MTLLLPLLAIPVRHLSPIFNRYRLRIAVHVAGGRVRRLATFMTDALASDLATREAVDKLFSSADLVCVDTASQFRVPVDMLRAHVPEMRLLAALRHTPPAQTFVVLPLAVMVIRRN